MDNEFEDLENELKRLRPARPSTFVVARIGQKLSAPRRPGWVAWAALPLAAAVAGVVFFRSEQPGMRPINDPPLAQARPETPSAPISYKPVSADNVLYDERDEGLITLANGSTARKYRASYVDTITWKNPQTQASLRWSVPRTVERVVPVQFQ
jgi:hypothetical protein